MVIDKNTILQIMGSLMKSPSLLGETDKYFLTPSDFESTFESYIFSAIHNLYIQGVERISVVDIDNYLLSHPTAYKVFDTGKGIEYLQDAEELSQTENFKYYYNQLKKINCLKDLNKDGFATNGIYSENPLDEHMKEINERFETLSPQDIILEVKKRLMNVESKYENGAHSTSILAADKIKELIEKLKISPDVGVSCQGDIFNTVVRGGRKGKFYLRSAGTGTGKTRSMAGDACYMAYPIRYNSYLQRWEHKGNAEKVLFVTTEQDFDEIQTLMLSYIADVNEETIIYGNYRGDEEDRVMKAAEVMEIYKDNFHLAKISDPSISQVRSVIRKHYLVNDVENVFYDYIFSSPALLSEYRDLRIREDVILGMLSTALKDLAVEMNMFIMSSTQVNGDLEEKKGIKNQSVLRGSKAIADKADIGCITMKVSVEEINILDKIIERYGIQPTQVTDIYKVRRGRYNDVRIWSNMDLGTCRKKDLFITDARFNEVDGFQVMNFVFDESTIGGYDDVLNLLNTGEVQNDNIEEIINNIARTENIQTIEIEPASPQNWSNML